MSRNRTISGNLRHLAGWLPDRPDHRDLEYIAHRGLAGGGRPPRVDLRAHCSSVEDQQTLGACTASAATSAMEFLYLRAGRAAPALSRLFCYYATRVWVESRDAAEDGGAMIRDVMKALAGYGCCLESTWPYDIRQLLDGTVRGRAGGSQGPPDPLVLQAPQPADDPALPGRGISRGRRVRHAGVDDQRGNPDVGNGEYPGPSEKLIGGHAALFCGYDDAARRLTFMNSWGKGWGEKGFGYLPYEFVANWLANDFWTIRTAEM